MLCGNCQYRRRCFPAQLQGDMLVWFENSIKQFTLPARRTIVEAGDPLEGYYALRKGSLKASSYTADGSERIVRFVFPGEIHGLAGGFRHIWMSTAATIEKASLCHIPQSTLDRGLLHKQVLKLTSARLRSEYKLSVLKLGSSTQRVAAFLLNISDRLGLDQPAERFQLPMSQDDIAGYLGLTKESVSRALRQLKTRKWISHHRGAVHILDPLSLRAFARE